MLADRIQESLGIESGEVHDVVTRYEREGGRREGTVVGNSEKVQALADSRSIGMHPKWESPPDVTVGNRT